MQAPLPTDGETPFLTRYIRFIIPALFVCAGFLLYANVLSGPLFWDDEQVITGNVYLRSWSHFPNLFTGNFVEGAGFVSNYWRPLMLTIFSAEWHLWGAHPAGYHIVNTLVHITNAIFLF